MKRFILIFAISALISACKTQSVCGPLPIVSVRHDTVMQHDSIYVHEFVQGDTVYVTHFRDRWRDRVVNRTDTVYVQATGDRQQTTGKSRDRPKPFYRNCTVGFWFLLLLLLGTTAFRILKAIYR